MHKNPLISKPLLRPFQNVCSASQNDYLLLLVPGVQLGAYGSFLSFLILGPNLMVRQLPIGTEIAPGCSSYIRKSIHP